MEMNSIQRVDILPVITFDFINTDTYPEATTAAAAYFSHIWITDEGVTSTLQKAASYKVEHTWLSLSKVI